MPSLPDEFRVNHRAASESLLRAAADDDDQMVAHELEKAVYFETEAMKSLTTLRQRALAMGFLHAVDMVQAVVEAERH